MVGPAPARDAGLPQYIVVDDPEIRLPGGQLFVRSGPVFPLGGGVLADGMKTGWALQSGLAFPLFDIPTSAGSFQFMGELGFNYESNSRTGTVPNDQTFFCFLCNHDRQVDALFPTDLTEIDRLAFQLGLGTRYYPGLLNRDPSRSIHLDLRMGLRMGGAFADVSQSVTPTLVAVRDAYLNHHPAFDPAELPVPSNRTETGFLVGLYAGVGLGVTWHDVTIGRWTGDIGLGAGVEVSQEWLDLGSISPSAHGLGTFTPTFTFSVGF